MYGHKIIQYNPIHHPITVATTLGALSRLMWMGRFSAPSQTLTSLFRLSS